MRDSWATSGIDLHLDRSGRRLRAGLEDALRDAVRSGRLAPGLRLPSSRTLAADLGLARNTVAEVYGQLVAEGWLIAQQGSGTQVAARPRTPAQPPARTAPPKRLRYDLTPGSPDTSTFPRSAWLSAARRALSDAPDEALGYGDPRGRPELREALANYLARARGVHASADRIVICSGFSQALGLICRAFHGRGAKTLGMEAYGVQQHRHIAKFEGLEIRSLPLDDAGARVDELDGADAAVLTAAHQFPLGTVLAPQRRSEVVRWAAQTGGWVIEDDYDGEFRYDRQPVGAMQALAPDQVIYAGTASKSLAPGVRLGWLVLPSALVDEVSEIQSLTLRNTSALDQLTLAAFIESGAYDRHIRRSRLTYRRRRDRLLAAVHKEAPNVRVSGIAAGLHALLRLPSGLGEHELIARAADHGLALDGLSAYAADEPAEAALVIGYGAPPEHAYTAALARLTAVLGGAG
jgi:GntR family transcriptional regulator/MocR family aminotransferase